RAARHRRGRPGRRGDVHRDLPVPARAAADSFPRGGRAVTEVVSAGNVPVGPLVSFTTVRPETGVFSRKSRPVDYPASLFGGRSGSGNGGRRTRWVRAR